MKIIFGFALVFFSSLNAFAYVPLPGNLHCVGDSHDAIEFNNPQVMQWKASTADQFHARGLVQGTVTQVYPNKTGHTHFAINIDSAGGGDIEIIYNDEFGALPALKPGMVVSACGDYITVGPKARLPSPMGAIIHWVHFNPGNRDGGVHPSGFLVINNQAYGFNTPPN